MSPSPTSQVSPLRLLVLSPSTPPAKKPLFAELLAALTGSPPPTETVTFAGYTQHEPLRLSNKYYTADVSIWCDEVPPQDGGPPRSDSTAALPLDTEDSDAELHPTLSTWKTQMLSDAAAEVRAVIGGVVLVVPLSGADGLSEDQLVAVEAVDELRSAVEDARAGADVALVLLLRMSSAVSDSDAVVEKVEQQLMEERGVLGWDIVAWDGDSSPNPERRDVYGEKVGIARVREVLEGMDWSTESGHTADDFSLGIDGDEESLAAEEDVDDDVKVDQLQGLLERVVAIKEAGAEMPRSERERFAKREIDRIMKQM